MFIPSFCPSRTCANHMGTPTVLWWSKAGFHSTRCFGRVQRFRCKTCGKTFSVQTFSIDFFAKRKIDYREIESRSSSSMSVRALARDMSCSTGSVLNRIDRLARQSIACHARLRPRATIYDSIAIDGFVSFDRSQYFPNNITVSITSGSRFVLSYAHATLRRSGRMRENQKKQRDTLYQGMTFEHRALERSFTELLDELARDRPPCRNRPLIVITDEKVEYARAFSRHALYRNQNADHRFAHISVNSRLPRTFVNPLFPSNYLEREIRKDQAAHHRESTCFCRNAANGMSRFACYIGWHNYSKAFLVKASIRELLTHGEAAGINRSDLVTERRNMFEDRAFLSRERLDQEETRIWTKRVPTPGQHSFHRLPQYAFD